MFSKTKEPQIQAPLAPLPQATKGRAPRSGGVPSIISGDLTVTGTLVSSGEVQIDGRVEGDVRAASLVIGEKASISGDVYADEAIVRGRVEGGIRARRVQLCATAHVEGNILHEALSVEAGAFFEGNCRHSDNPLGDTPDNTRRAPTMAPAVQSAPKPVAAPVVTSTPIKVETVTQAVAPPRAAAGYTQLKA